MAEICWPVLARSKRHGKFAPYVAGERNDHSRMMLFFTALTWSCAVARSVRGSTWLD